MSGAAAQDTLGSPPLASEAARVAATRRPLIGAGRWTTCLLRRALAPAGLATMALLVLVAALTGYWWGVAETAVYPGHADSAFYYGVAQNIHAGRGFTINYIWEFLSGQPDLPRFAFDYWMPLPSLLMAWGLGVSNTITAATDVTIVMAVLVAGGTYALARVLTRSWLVAAAAAAVVVVQPVVSTNAVRLDSPLYLTAFALLAMVAAVRARRWPWLWPLAGALAGLAYLSRGEGALLMAVLLVAVLAWSPRGQRLWFAAATLLGFAAVAARFWIACLHYFGTLTPPAESSFPFIGHYEDLFRLHIDRSWSAFFGPSIHDFLSVRLASADQAVSALAVTAQPVDAVVLLVLSGAAAAGAARAARGTTAWKAMLACIRSPWFVPVAFAGAIVFVDVVITPVVADAGASIKVQAAVLPVVVICAMTGLARLQLPRGAAVGIVALLVALPCLVLAQRTRASVANANRVGASQQRLGHYLDAESACLGRPVVLMTRNPWELTEALGIRSVQIPNAPLDDILAVARRYGVTDILMTSTRPALAKTAALLAPGGPLSRSPVMPVSLGIYRVKATVGEPRC